MFFFFVDSVLFSTLHTLCDCVCVLRPQFYFCVYFSLYFREIVRVVHFVGSLSTVRISSASFHGTRAVTQASLRCSISQNAWSVGNTCNFLTFVHTRHFCCVVSFFSERSVRRQRITYTLLRCPIFSERLIRRQHVFGRRNI